MSIEEKVRSLGLELPEITIPGGNYVSVNIRGSIAYIAIQFPIYNEKYLYQGRLGTELDTKEGYKAMQLCALNFIAQIKENVGLERLVGVNHIDAYFQAAPGWDDSPKVVNGASDLLLNLFEDKGQHSRAIIGVDRLPRNFSVGLSGSVTIQ